MSRPLHLAAALGCLLAASVPAQAAVISGNFEGTVSSGTYQSGPSTFVDLAGSSVTGSFAVNSVDGATPPIKARHTSCPPARSPTPSPLLQLAKRFRLET